MIHKQFRAWRERLGLTQQNAAAALGLHMNAVEFYEGTWTPSLGFKSHIPKIVRLAMAAIEANVPDPDTLGTWMEKLNVVAISERQDDAADYYLRNAELMVWHLLSTVHVMSDSEMTIVHLALYAAGREPEYHNKSLNERFKRWANETLQTYGLKVVAFLDRKWLAVANHHPRLNGIFYDTQWAGRSGLDGVWTQACGWVPNARRSQRRIGGKATRCWLLPMDDWILLPESETQAGEDA